MPLVQYSLYCDLQAPTPSYKDMPVVQYSLYCDLQAPGRLRYLLDVSLQLASSTRPQDCNTAAYLLRLITQQPLLYSVICAGYVDQLNSATSHHWTLRHTRNRGGATDTTQGVQDSTQGVGDTTQGVGHTTQGVGDTTQGVEDSIHWVGDTIQGVGDTTQGVGDTSQGVGDTTQGVGHALTRDGVVGHCLQWCDTGVVNDAVGRCSVVLTLLLSQLDSQVTVARRSLVHAASTRPMYPTMHCIRYLLKDINLK